MKITRLLYLFVLILLFSCEGYTSYQLDIENKSSETIYVEGNSFFSGSIDTVIQSNQKITVSFYDQMGGRSNSGKASDYIDSLLVFSEFDTVIKDYRVSENWLIDSRQVKRIPSEYFHQFTFEVHDDDF